MMNESSRRYNLRDTRKKPQGELLKRWEMESSKLISNENRRIPLETVKTAIQSAFEDGMFELWRITLKCPLSGKRIKVPARYAECTHIECFDLETFLRMKTQKNIRVCPICQKEIEKPLANLRIDKYIENVLSTLPDAIQVELMSDGSFTEVHEELVIEPSMIDDEEPYVQEVKLDGPNWDVANWNSEWPKSDQLKTLPNMYGSSLLHYPMKQPRDCTTLRIPFDYCQCPGKYIQVTDGELTQLLARKSVEKLNQEIKILEYSDICETLKIDKNATVVLMELKTFSKEARNFKIQFQTQPGGGQFSTKMRMMENQKVEFTANRFERLNKHGHQSQCAYKNTIVAQLCYCKT